MRQALLAGVLLLGACDGLSQPEDTSRTYIRYPSETAFTLAPTNLPTFFDCLRARGAAVVSAHRGGPTRGYAENAIWTFANTLQHSPAFLEVDVARTRDGALVLMHDDSVDRTTTGSGAIASLTLEELRRLRLEDESGTALFARVPTLREALEWAADKTVLELDVKRGVSYEDVVREVKAAGAMSRVVFITYSVDGAARVARLSSEAMIYTTIAGASDLDQLQRHGVDLSRIVAWLGSGELNPAVIAALAARGVEARIGRFGDGADGGRFADAARSGARIIAVDDIAAAVRDLDANDGADGYAALQCVAAER